MPSDLKQKAREWLCKIGIHSWETLGFTNLLLSDTLKRCRRCGIGQLDIAFGQGYERYSREEMARALVGQKG